MEKILKLSEYSLIKESMGDITRDEWNKMHQLTDKKILLYTTHEINEKEKKNISDIGLYVNRIYGNNFFCEITLKKEDNIKNYTSKLDELKFIKYYTYDTKEYHTILKKTSLLYTFENTIKDLNKILLTKSEINDLKILFNKYIL